MFKIVVALILFSSWNSNAQEQEPASLDKFRNQAKVKIFLGTYRRESITGGVESVVSAERDRLELFYVIGGNSAANSFSLDLKRLGSKIVQKRSSSRGAVVVETFYDIQGTEAISEETQTARTWKSFEREVLRIKGSELINERSRKYFKRKYIWFGPWVDDTTSFDGRRNAFEKSVSMLKLSSSPIPLDVFFDMLWSRPATYIQLRGSTSAESLRQEIKQGNFDVVSPTPPVQKEVERESATILTFPTEQAKRNNCEKGLTEGGQLD